ncbi:multicopper oxidase family protein [Agromyces archimandritae]|uniref:Multicopper oxidase domain-containing protein n=1 Tax=Agromyces archimandritae TaxID=2781962 RepID=A0A975FP22_9MICO|nr:multicopper oxidase domain-containing protein [Agromyces archimandritae]QTX04561.1 multicopper oxidase domain-containing protein [Agromyces archimandritae]
MSTTAIRRPRAVIATTAALAAGAAGIALAFAGCGLAGPGTVSTIGEVDFARPLAIPPLAESWVDADGARVFELEARAGSTEFTDGVPSETWGFNGPYLGPTLVAERGERVRVEVANALDEPTSVHWHGMHLPAKMDGGPHQAVEPGGEWMPEWEIDQPAATLWYHPHPHGETERHVERGLAGMFLLHDDAERALGLPSEYGVDDVPVIVQDASFDDDGRRGRRPGGFAGALGDDLLVNGTLGPFLDVTSEVTRLRLLNGSTARIYDFAFDDRRTVQLIGTDGGLLEAPVDTEHVRLSPGERAEVLVRMEPGERAVLQSRMSADALGAPEQLAAPNGGTDAFDVLELRAGSALGAADDAPDRLVDVPDFDPADVAVERDFSLGGHEIDDREMDMGRIDETVTVGTLERWTVRNEQQLPHSFHVHDVQFRIESIGGQPPPAELAGWKDTIYLAPRTDFRLLMRFDDHADPETPYMYHCHLLQHEDQGMMGQFVVVEPGGRATMTERNDHDHH